MRTQSCTNNWWTPPPSLPPSPATLLAPLFAGMFSSHWSYQDISHSLAGLWWRFRFSCLLGVIGAAALLNGPQGHCSVRAWWWQWKHLFKTKWAHHSHINLLEMKMILQAILWKARKVSSIYKIKDGFTWKTAWFAYLFFQKVARQVICFKTHVTKLVLFSWPWAHCCYMHTLGRRRAQLMPPRGIDAPGRPKGTAGWQNPWGKETEPQRLPFEGFYYHIQNQAALWTGSCETPCFPWGQKGLNHLDDTLVWLDWGTMGKGWVG